MGTNGLAEQKPGLRSYLVHAVEIVLSTALTDATSKEPTSLEGSISYLQSAVQ